MSEIDRAREAAASALDDFRASLAFLTVIPARHIGASAARPRFSSAAWAFPLVGGVVGGLGAAVLVVANLLSFPTLIAAILAVLSLVLVTGALHEDGLADTTDGFGGGATAARKLEIMDDSRVGTYGAAAVVFSLILRIASLDTILSIGVPQAVAALIAAEAASRAAVVRLWYRLPAARPGGLSAETGAPDEKTMTIALAVAAAIVIVAILPTFGFWAAMIGGGSLIAVAAAFTWLVAAQIGGRTGDTLGACQQATLVAFLVGLTPFAA